MTLFKHIIIAFFVNLLLSASATAQDKPALPYGELVQYLPVLKSDGQKLVQLHTELCSADAAPSPAALLASQAKELVESMRVASKKVNGRAGLLYFHDGDPTSDPAIQEDAKRLEKELNGLDKLLTMTRANLETLSPDAPETAENACVAMGKLNDKLARVNVGLFVE